MADPANRSSPHRGLAILIDHGGEVREFADESTAATFEEDEPISSVGERLGWVIVIMTDDWASTFAAPAQ